MLPMLPDGFRWIPRYQHAGDELALVLDGVHVAALLSGVDGRWTARLEAHWPIEAPLVLRPCSNREAGREGVEAWAARHADRLRREIRDPLVVRDRWAPLVAAGAEEGDS